MHCRDFFLFFLIKSKKAPLELRILTFYIEGHSCLDLLQKLQQKKTFLEKITMPTMVERAAGERIACSDPSV